MLARLVGDQRAMSTSTVRRIEGPTDASAEPGAKSVRARVPGRSFRPWVLLSFAAFVPPVTFSGSRFFSVLVLAGIFALLALSMDLVLGYAGQLSLGHPALFGTAAYTSSILSVTHGWPVELAMLTGIASAVALATLTSPILRLTGVYFALATLALTVLVESVLRNWASVTGGSSGFLGIPGFSVLGFDAQSLVDDYWVAWIPALLATLGAVQLTRSRFGRAVFAVHHDEIAAEVAGVPSATIKVKVWLLAAVLAGLAGVLYAHHLQFVSPGQFGLVPAIMLLIMIAIGGIGTAYGAVIGALVVRLFPEVFASLQEHTVLVYGVAIVGLTILVPDGVVGGLPRAGRSLRRHVQGTPT